MAFRFRLHYLLLLGGSLLLAAPARAMSIYENDDVAVRLLSCKIAGASTTCSIRSEQKQNNLSQYYFHTTTAELHARSGDRVTAPASNFEAFGSLADSTAKRIPLHSHAGRVHVIELTFKHGASFAPRSLKFQFGYAFNVGTSYWRAFTFNSEPFGKNIETVLFVPE